MDLDSAPVYGDAPTVVRCVVWPGIVVCDASFLRDDELVHLYLIEPSGGYRIDGLGVTDVDALNNIRSLLNWRNESTPWVNLPADRTDYV